MSSATAVNLLAQAIVLVVKLAGPVLVATLVVGLTISLVQAVTSVQEFTLTFLPKLVAVAAILAVSGHWMVSQLVDYTDQLFRSIPALLGS
ncbi:MAG TPA: flagellar biosynthesis protein FliQ [Acidimicrobiales bacterium]|jgi:flagellar biosynthetic protein FliQ|nr:flagellar biosynthesis protein FliQ [Acidimicrobiales bacterium]